MKKKLTALILAVTSACAFALTSCGGSGAGSSFPEGSSPSSQGTQKPKTDEGKIRACIEQFENAYNDGDFEGVLECMEPKIRNTMRALFNTLGGIAGGQLGVDISLSDLFSLGIGMNDGDFISFDIQDVAIGDGKASVTANMSLAPTTQEKMYIILVKEDGEWLIENITDKKSSIGSGKTVVVTELGEDGFVDGIAKITYEQDGQEFWGLINTAGEIVYEREGKWNGWTHIGNGVGYISEYNAEDDTLHYQIINTQGEVIATSKELGFDDIIHNKNYEWGIDGHTWVYKYQSGINGAKTLYNCVDSKGEFVGEWIDLQIVYNYGNNTEITFVNANVIIVERGWDMAVLNLDTNSVLWLRDTEILGVHNGNIYGIGGAYYASKEGASKRENGMKFPAYYCIKPDGTIEDIFDETWEDVFKYGIFTEGKLIHGHDRYMIPDADAVYIYDLETRNVGKYTDYSTDMVEGIDFFGDYGVVEIHGLDYNFYFTLIDENGKQQFEPIIYYDSIALNEGMIVYRTKFDGSDSKGHRYAVANTQGEVVVPESAGYCYISAFSDGLAVAQIGETEEWVIIDTQGDVVVENFYVKE